MTVVGVLLASLLLFGHGLFWAAVLNRMHSFGIPRRLNKAINKLIMAVGAGIPLLVALWWLLGGRPQWPADAAQLLALSFWQQILLGYMAVCWTAAAIGLAVWTWRKVFPHQPGIERRRCATVARLDSPAVLRQSGLMARLPGNQSLTLERIERELQLPRWPAALDGLSILHVTDLHFTGRQARAYFEQVAEVCNDMHADLVAITGDLIDHRDCLDWLPATLGRLSAPLGVYYVRGNHDVKVDQQLLWAALDECGLIGLGGRWLSLATGRGELILAGNELPWFRPAADMSDCPPRLPDGPPRVLLSHSPDRLAWAVRHEFDLMLAGHVHGGQVQLPWFGPVLSPSWHGVKYANGLFFRPPTALCVSRGVSGEYPVRFFCRPEVTKLVLRAPQQEADSHAADEPPA